jgi:GNAT superfamily N-acetyltransferase
MLSVGWRLADILPPMLPTAADLAPGDAKSTAVDLSTFEVHRIRSVDDPFFEAAYGRLWEEFGALGEMERRETLAERFRLGADMRYEMVLVRNVGALAAVRDHTAIDAAGEVAVHLSHNLVAPDFRRSGLAGWMRAFPVALAREFRPGWPITLVAEMEYDDASQPNRLIRLRAYEKAGFRKVDPKVVDYHQPDFRSPEEIDASGGPQPPRFQLLLRRVGREGEESIAGGELSRLVTALYRMYGAQFRPQDMAHPALDVARYPSAAASIALLPPTAT